VYIEQDGKVFGELLDCQRDDMFWDSYLVGPKDDLSKQMLLTEASWLKFTFRNRRTGAIAKNAFSNGAPREGMRVSMRALHL
jgi:hypothetical protein